MFVFSDRGCVYGVQYDPAVHFLPAGRSQKQQAIRGPATDTITGDEPHARPSGNYSNRRVHFKHNY